MISFNGLRGLLRPGLLIGLLVTFFATTLASVPAQATLGSPLPIDMQLVGSWNGVIIPIGRVYGTLQFDDGNSLYRLDVTVCRQSSYVVPTLSIDVNDDGSNDQRFSWGGPAPRPDVCPTGFSWGIEDGFPYAGVILKIRVRIDGLFFDGQTATPKTKSTLYDNPFN
jgi:hypothetical protein